MKHLFRFFLLIAALAFSACNRDFYEQDLQVQVINNVTNNSTSVTNYYSVADSVALGNLFALLHDIQTGVNTSNAKLDSVLLEIAKLNSRVYVLEMKIDIQSGKIDLLNGKIDSVNLHINNVGASIMAELAKKLNTNDYLLHQQLFAADVKSLLLAEYGQNINILTLANQIQNLIVYQSAKIGFAEAKQQGATPAELLEIVKTCVNLDWTAELQYRDALIWCIQSLDDPIFDATSVSTQRCAVVQTIQFRVNQGPTNYAQAQINPLPTDLAAMVQAYLDGFTGC